VVNGKELVNKQQFVFKATVATSQGTVNTEALTDSGATGNCASRSFTQQHKLQTFALKKPLQLRLGDGIVGQTITHGALIPLSHGDHQSEELFYMVEMSGYDLILGMPWLEEHNPQIDWRDRTMSFCSEHCHANCLLKGEPVLVYSSRHCKKRNVKEDTSNAAYASMDIEKISGLGAAAMAG
jgi:hypothetical protein